MNTERSVQYAARPAALMPVRTHASAQADRICLRCGASAR
jgi:hypothetical protein